MDLTVKVTFRGIVLVFAVRLRWFSQSGGIVCAKFLVGLLILVPTTVLSGTKTNNPRPFTLITDQSTSFQAPGQ
ncbi:hypothetical protein BKA59DRAFT_481806 [Fusarium tricinctum]|jgi:uncharacterized membrane protein (UPF0136 family)|uniref:Uncharacterized protein n=1 Tax=Fusarium tricinctum TaxID=61284 RepID=A0A8K0W997_9HYPO|nr:hypothetical protein BKA59DRAFT_481806 [Fusarium tricinctum]